MSNDFAKPFSCCGGLAFHADRCAYHQLKLESLSPDVPDWKTRALAAEAKLVEMVEKAADQKLDGYKELGRRAAEAENRADAFERSLNLAISDIALLKEKLAEVEARAAAMRLRAEAVCKTLEHYHEGYDQFECDSQEHADLEEVLHDESAGRAFLAKYHAAIEALRAALDLLPLGHNKPPSTLKHALGDCHYCAASRARDLICKAVEVEVKE